MRINSASIAQILAAAEELTGEADGAILWFKDKPIVGFGGMTALELVDAGHGDAVLAHLKDLRDGNFA